METWQTWFDAHQQQAWWRVVFILAGTMAVAVVLRVAVLPILRRLVRHTRWTFDDEVLDLAWPAAYRTVLLVGLNLAGGEVITSPRIEFWLGAIITSLLVLIWGNAVNRMGTLLGVKISRNQERFRWIETRSLPLISFVQKVIVFGVMTYLIMSTWRLDLTGWLASAGVVGIAVGFAARDTLANFISGVFILMDAPYQVGQYIVIDGVTRGMVTDIGMRSTRLLTRDNVEVSVPNAVIAGAKIVNESSGPSTLMRVRVDVGVAYGSDVDQVRDVLLACVDDVPETTTDPAPTVRFIAMGDSALQFQVRVFVTDPEFRGRVVDQLNTRIYKNLRAAGVEIPFPQRDLHIKDWPSPPG